MHAGVNISYGALAAKTYAHCQLNDLISRRIATDTSQAGSIPLLSCSPRYSPAFIPPRHVRGPPSGNSRLHNHHICPTPLFFSSRCHVPLYILTSPSQVSPPTCLPLTNPHRGEILPETWGEFEDKRRKKNFSLIVFEWFRNFEIPTLCFLLRWKGYNTLAITARYDLLLDKHRFEFTRNNGRIIIERRKRLRNPRKTWERGHGQEAVNWEEKEDPGVVRGLFVSVSVYMASAAPLNQVERSRGLLCKLQPWLKSSALKYWMINQRGESSSILVSEKRAFSQLSRNSIRFWTLSRNRTRSEQTVLPSSSAR